MEISEMEWIEVEWNAIERKIRRGGVPEIFESFRVRGGEGAWKDASKLERTGCTRVRAKEKKTVRSVTHSIIQLSARDKQSFLFCFCVFKHYSNGSKSARVPFKTGKRAKAKFSFAHTTPV